MGLKNYENLSTSQDYIKFAAQLKNLKTTVEAILDFFYPPFSKFMDKQTYRYVICGGGNTVLGIVIFFISYNFVLKKQILNLGVFAFKPHVAAFFISFIITFPIGFLLSRYVVWTESNVRGRIQLFRYFLLVLVCIFLNYIFLRIFVEQLHIYPTISQIITTGIVITFSYATQKHFTFKVKQA